MYERDVAGGFDEGRTDRVHGHVPQEEETCFSDERHQKKLIRFELFYLSPSERGKPCCLHQADQARQAKTEGGLCVCACACACVWVRVDG